jgi:predicted metal-dependent peptidase
LKILSASTTKNSQVPTYPGEDGKESSSSERRKEESDWKTRISQAAQVAKSRGELPGGLERYVQEFLTPRIDWRAVLASYLTDVLENDYSWKQPNRRYLNSGIYLPSLIGEPSGNVLILIDTSGSISEKDMELLAAEAQGIITSYEIELDVVYVDSRFQGHQRFTSSDVPLKLKPKGGGGTSYRPGFEWAKENGLFPSCAVYLTDGWCNSFPDESPAYPVLWVVTGDYPCKDFKAQFGEVIRMK